MMTVVVVRGKRVNTHYPLQNQHNAGNLKVLLGLCVKLCLVERSVIWSIPGRCEDLPGIRLLDISFCVLLVHRRSNPNANQRNIVILCIAFLFAILLFQTQSGTATRDKTEVMFIRESSTIS